MTDPTAGDKTVLQHIHDLVAEEKDLRRAHGAPAMTDDDRARLTDLQGQLDQAWDLLRQRRAHEEFHEDPNESSERPVQNVTRYLQ